MGATDSVLSILIFLLLSISDDFTDSGCEAQREVSWHDAHQPSFSKAISAASIIYV